MAKKIMVMLIIAVLGTTMFMAVNASSSGFSLGGSNSILVPTAPDQGGVIEKVVKILEFLQWVGFVVAIGMIIWVGIKYLTSGAGEKAKAKETMIPIVIGAILVACALPLATAIFNIFN